MLGLNSHTKEAINRLVSDLFDKVSLRFLGNLPKLQQKRVTLVGFEQSRGLANLFVQALNNKYLNHIEQDVLKGLVEGASSYIDLLKGKTANEIVNKIEALAREARLNKDRIPQESINAILEEGFGKATSNLETIIMSEGTKTRNLGMTMDILRTSESRDPTVGFAVIRDGSECEVCLSLFLMEDKVTPRLWKLSELNAGYYKRGDKVPSLLGNHPNCKCTIFSVPIDWGFNSKGFLSFIGSGHDELENQRK